ncbi:MAG: hypothetical protein NTX79_03230 [Candidatus Micrarchaeota archaeon]|nr:hypothetical protein [Candidatus Micrarchaeota archaeon]
MVCHTNYGSDEKSRSWLQKDDALKKLLKNYEYYVPSGERIIVEVLEVDDPKYKDGIMYTFRCLSSDDKTLFAVENSHGKPHVHLRGKKTDVDYDWKAAYAKFQGMLSERFEKK